MSTKTEVEFRISGPCLSFLLYDCECSKCDQVGFLIGEKKSETTQAVSDQEMEMKIINTTITINGSYAIGLPFMFCNPLGRVDVTLLKEVLGNLQKKVLGWYSFRRNCNHIMSMRDVYLHSELLKALEPDPSDYFIFGLITAVESDESDTHSKRFTFFTERHRRLYPISVFQTNLGEPEDNVYKKPISGGESSLRLREIFSSKRPEDSARDAMTSLHSTMNKHITSLQGSVTRLHTNLDQLLSPNKSSENCIEKGVNACSKAQVASTSSSKGEPRILSPEF